MVQDYGQGGSFTVDLEGPYGGGEGGASVKLTQITVPAASWKGAQSPFSQVVQIGAISINSKINLQPSVDQLEMLRDMDEKMFARYVGYTRTICENENLVGVSNHVLDILRK